MTLVAQNDAMGNVPPMLLVVEDEQLVRMGIAKIAEEAGFRVLEAATAGEALSILNAGSPICAIVSDVRMPGKIDGLMLAAHVRERWPSTRIVLTSGHLSPTSQLIAGDVVSLPKPFRAEKLIETLENLAEA